MRFWGYAVSLRRGALPFDFSDPAGKKSLAPGEQRLKRGERRPRTPAGTAIVDRGPPQTVKIARPFVKFFRHHPKYPHPSNLRFRIIAASGVAVHNKLQRFVNFQQTFTKTQ